MKDFLVRYGVWSNEGLASAVQFVPKAGLPAGQSRQLPGAPDHQGPQKHQVHCMSIALCNLINFNRLREFAPLKHRDPVSKSSYVGFIIPFQNVLT